MAQAISKMETTQTAVDWYRQEIMKVLFASDDNTNIYENDIHEQALAMERQQIVDAFYDGMQSSMFDPNKGRALIYYNETYNK